MSDARMQGPSFSVIIPAYNAAKSIGKCVEALLKQSTLRERYEVIVVDDGSTDDTREALADYDVILLPQPHHGPAAARNSGVAIAKGSIVLFTDADCVPASNWIEALTLPFQDETIAGTKGTYKTQQKELIARFTQIEYEDRYDRMRGKERIDFVDTYSAAYRKSLLLEHSGFDSALPTAAVEDIDLSFRLARRGLRMVFVSDAAVYHQHPRRVQDYLRRKFRYGFWRFRLYRRYPDKMLTDSHTPHTLKLQILLVYSALLALAGGLVSFYSVYLTGALFSLFFLSTLPFSIKAYRKDKAVGFVSPVLLVLRALALGAGLWAGLVVQLKELLIAPLSSKAKESPSDPVR